MRNGFIFNTDLCVSCKACSAACFLENGWSVSAREIYTANSELLPYWPVTHLSLACNHCKKPLCLEGCPAGAFYKDSSSQAIIIESKKCIGCNYCTWNCPYDAPKINCIKGYTEKCNLCYNRIIEEIEPACTSACPTGALKYGAIPDPTNNSVLNWFPEKDIDPSIQIKGSINKAPLQIFPEMAVHKVTKEERGRSNKKSIEWSLVIFSFLSTISVSFTISKLMGGISPGSQYITCLAVLAGIFSLFHLRIVIKAPRAILNPGRSPLSREILLFLTFSVFTSATLFSDNSIILIASVISGLLLLITIDSVYTFADRSRFLMMHSGQTFLTGLIMSSYLLNAVVPFVFIAVVKIAFNLYSIIKNRPDHNIYILIIIRLSFLIIVMSVFLSGIYYNKVAVLILFFSGELADRILYYLDFVPVNINSEISKFLISSHNEEENY